MTKAIVLIGIILGLLIIIAPHPPQFTTSHFQRLSKGYRKDFLFII